MDAKLFAQQHDAVPGFAHRIANGAAHAAGTAAYVVETSTGRFGRVSHSRLKRGCLRLQVNG
jgi:hypothetical protein